MKFLLDMTNVVPQGGCLSWQPVLLHLIAASNLAIAAACCCISVALISLLLRWRNVPYATVIRLAAAFLLVTGTSHLLTTITLWTPVYWLKVAADVMTALLCVVTACVVWPVIEKILSAERELQAARSVAAAAQRRLEELATTDSLTGLANRRHFDAFLESEMRRAKRAGTSVALIMIDADKFKPFNDMYGHPAGDACLRIVATAIRGQLHRAGDLAARFGGDEFAAIVPGADEAGAVLIAERIVKAVQDAAILHPASAIGIVTASAGVAAIVPSLSTFEPHHLLQVADAALYAAKGAGGNQVCSVEQAARLPVDIFAHVDPEGTIGAAQGDASWSPRMPAGLDFVSILRGIPFGVLVTDSAQPDDPIVFANSGFTRLTGYSLKESVGRNPRFLQGADTDPHSVAALAEAMLHGTPIQREVLNYRKNGQAFWTDLFMQPLLDRHEKVVGFVGLLIDQTARHRAEDARQDSEAKLAAIVENLPGYVFQRVLTPGGRLVYSYFSQSYWRLRGFDRAPQTPDHDPFGDIYLPDTEKVHSSIASSLASLSTCTVEFRSICADGSLLWLRTKSTPRLLGNGNVVWDGVGVDITAELDSKNSLAYLAYHDPLTGLCNRVLFIETLEAMCAPGVADTPCITAFSIDIDAFQKVNDTWGSSIGDAVLRCFAERLIEFAGTAGVAARLGGDEFGVATLDALPALSTTSRAALLCSLLQSPMRIRDCEINIQVCVGATVYPFVDCNVGASAEAAEEVVKQTSFALAEAKRAGAGSFRLYCKQLDDRERNRNVLRQSMRRGLQELQFVLHYHPIVNLATGEIIGAEALLRWAHPELGMQRPDLFIPEAESSGLIVPLGAWVIKTALLEMQEWQKLSGRALRIAINVSAVQLLDPDFLAMLDEALQDTGADASLIDLELTESVLIDGSALAVLQSLRERGCHLAVDDFGTGYASFRYLQTLPVNSVKIDQTFVRHMVIDSSDASIVRAISAVAKSLGLGVIAEGIETSLQRDFLRNEGCQIGQGYLFSLPLAAEDFRWLLTSNATLPLGDDYTPTTQRDAAKSTAPPARPEADPHYMGEAI